MAPSFEKTTPRRLDCEVIVRRNQNRIARDLGEISVDDEDMPAHGRKGKQRARDVKEVWRGLDESLMDQRRAVVGDEVVLPGSADHAAPTRGVKFVPRRARRNPPYIPGTGNHSR